MMLGSDDDTKKRCGEEYRNTQCVFRGLVHSSLGLTSTTNNQQKKIRGASLIEQHERTTSAKEAEKARSGETDEPPAFWDRDRDMALGGRLMDDKTRNKFISEAKGLGDRFGSGKSGGFL